MEQMLLVMAALLRGARKWSILVLCVLMAEIGSVWASGTWDTGAWAADTWADVTPSGGTSAGSYRVEAYLSSAWTDITGDVVNNPIACNWGMSDNSAVDLMADTGEMSFLLDNQEDLYIPGLATALTDWDKNTPVRLVVTFEDIDYHFRYYVDRLDVVSEVFEKWVSVSCVDWMDYAGNYPLTTPEIEEDKRADEAISTIVAAMPIAPQAQSLEEGQETFVTVFDNVTPKTRAYSEITKLTNSEFGYTYLVKDQVNGETLFFEDWQYRNGLRTLGQIPIVAADSGFLLLETGDYLLQEDGTSKIILNEVEDAVFDNNMQSLEIQYGGDVVNRFTTIVYPRGVDVTNQVLFNLESPVEIGSGGTVQFRTNYSDPSGGNQIAAKSDSMVTPVATTDYLMNTQSDGGGDNITANLTVVANYGTEGVTYALTNDSQKTGYVTKLQARGLGVYTYNPIEDEQTNAVSIAANGYQNQSIEQRYQQTVAFGAVKGKSIIAFEKNPRIDLQKVNFITSINGDLMPAFLGVDIGDLVHIKEDDAGIDSYYYIQRKDFAMHIGNYITFSWVVRTVSSLLLGLSPIAVEFDAASADDGVSYGIVPYTVNLRTKTFAAWVYKEDLAEHLGTVMGTTSEVAGDWIVTSLDKIIYKVYTTATPGIWRTDDTHPVDEWFHLAITQDTSASALTDPIIYINGSSVAFTELQTPTGTYLDESGVSLTLANAYDNDGNGASPLNGKIADARMYDEILSPTDITTLYNGGNPDTSLVTDGMIFQSPNVKTKQLSDYIDTTLTNENVLIDNMFRIIGTPKGAPVGRDFP